jgi:hypothetical protein
VSATDISVDANAGPARGTRIGLGLGALLRGVPEPTLGRANAPDALAGSPQDHLAPVFEPLESP